ncbi:MAG: leucine-rich repeat domain-containing protein, partial [Candidatus Hodarchaeales archaeon]
MKIKRIYFLLIFISLIVTCSKDLTSSSNNDDSGDGNQDPTEVTVRDSIGVEGGILTEPNSNITLYVPPGALSEKVELVIGPAKDIPIDTLQFLNSSYYFGPEEQRFNIPVTITFPYNESELPRGVSEQQIQIHHYNRDDNFWSTAGDSLNKLENTVKAFVDHLGVFTIGGNLLPLPVTLFDITEITTNSVKLTWSISQDSDFGSYEGYFATTPNVSWEDRGIGAFYNRNTTDTVITQLLSNTTYYFKIFVVDKEGISCTGSNEKSATTAELIYSAGDFADPNLETAVREALGKPEGAITEQDLLTLTELDAEYRYIYDLTGLEYCKNLEWLHLGRNRITSIEPLSGLVKLKFLDLYESILGNIDPLTNLVELEFLNLERNHIETIGALSELVNLKEL